MLHAGWTARRCWSRAAPVGSERRPRSASLALGARVGIVGRDAARAQAAASDIRAVQANPAVDVFVADMSSQAEVRRLAAEVIATYSRLDVLVNNVGGYWAHRHVTADGLEHTFAVNHLASFLLTNLLLDRLKASAPARVVTVSSGAQSLGRIDFDDLQSVRNYSGQRAYNQSKLANVMFTYELARRLEGTGVTATVLHPGVTRTDFGAEDQAWYFKKGSGLARRFMKSPTRGAETPVYLASSPEVEGVSGAYFANGSARKSSKLSYDLDAAARLWQVSADLVGTSDAGTLTVRETFAQRRVSWAVRELRYRSASPATPSPRSAFRWADAPLPRRASQSSPSATTSRSPCSFSRAAAWSRISWIARWAGTSRPYVSTS